LEEVKEKENPRDNVTARKYRKQIEWRRIKVRQLLARGYSQSEISRELNISQPTISRDISFIYEESIMNPKIYDMKMGQENINILFGIEEGIRSIWKIIDDGRIEAKTRMKSIDLLGQYYLLKCAIMDAQSLFADWTKKKSNYQENDNTRYPNEGKVKDRKVVGKYPVTQGKVYDVWD
jgi:predicted transcriptional regulator